MSSTSLGSTLSMFRVCVTVLSPTYLSPAMPESREELALELSREAFAEQRTTEARLSERGTSILQAASVVIPVAAIAVAKGPTGALIPFGLAALAYAACAYQALRAMFPRSYKTTVRGGALLALAKDKGATLRDMRESAALYLDQSHAANLQELRSVSRDIERAIALLAVEIIALAVALGVTVAG